MRRPSPRAVETVRAIMAWYVREAYGRWEGPGCLPYYCDPARVGSFAVDPAALARGDDAALFRLFVGTAMFQVRRDVDVMAIQRAMPAREARAVLSPRRLRTLVEASRCEHVGYAEAFDAHCSVGRDLARGRGVCDWRPRTACHVKAASQAMRRMGDMGKIPTSAWLHFYRDGSLSALVDRVAAETAAPSARADRVVDALTRVYRVGRKLATMYVSALTVPALAPGLTPWHPRLDGAHLVVVDTNVAQVVDALRGPRAATSYEARARWVRRVAAEIDLAALHPALPPRSARLVQQALYLYRSAANRADKGDRCARGDPCAGCVAAVCPFAGPTAVRGGRPGGLEDAARPAPGRTTPA